MTTNWRQVSLSTTQAGLVLLPRETLLGLNQQQDLWLGKGTIDGTAIMRLLRYLSRLKPRIKLITRDNGDEYPFIISGK